MGRSLTVAMDPLHNDTAQPPILRRLGAAARVLATMTRILLGAGDSSTVDFQLRCITFALVAGFLTCGFFGSLQWLSGEPWQGFFLGTTGLLYGGCILLYRRTHSIEWTMNGMAAVTWLGVVEMMCLQGGIQTPTSWWLVTLSYLLATAGQQRSALIWLGISAVTLLVFLWLERFGVIFPVRFGAWPLLFEFSVQVGLFALIVFFALVLSAARVESSRRADEAYHAALAASAAKSRFLATMSHEIRTPLNGVIGAAELLGGTAVNEQQRQLIDTLRYSGIHLKSLIDDILDFSRIEAGKLELEDVSFDPGLAVRQTVDGLALLARGKGLACDCHVADDVPSLVRGDPARLRQIISNLVGNAIKFTHSGRIDIDVTTRPSTTEAEVPLVIRVRDTGIGIAADKLPRLFKAFSQTDDSTTRLYGGSGLGLAISQELARRMGGEILVESKVGSGTTFTVALYLGVASAPVVEQAAADPATLTVSGLRVLLVEDNPVNMTLGVAMLEQLGCTVDTAENGAEGVTRWRDARPDLVLIDCHMPVMDGLSATREIRSSEACGTRTPIVALSASAFAEDRAACLDAGMDDFLAKPYTFDQLRDTVARLARS